MPKVDLQADYSTAKVRGGPLVAGKGICTGIVGMEPDPAHLCFQGVLGAGYQALRLARVLLAGQELMLRGLHWFL